MKFICDLHASCGDSSNGSDQSEAATNQRSQKAVDALLDLVVLEGIYPSLSFGVGIPVERRLKSALKGGFTTRSLSKVSDERSEDQELLTRIVKCLCPISLSKKGLGSSIQDRMSVDLIAAAGELAFSPTFNVQERQRFAPTFEEIIDR